jgi:tetraacyldisaccharide-1-P 4'-kinase
MMHFNIDGLIVILIIVIIDQSFVNTKSFFTHNLLPLGDLREGFESLIRADVIIFNRKFLEKEEINSEIKDHFEGKNFLHLIIKQ